jgi:hypothetical protein
MIDPYIIKESTVLDFFATKASVDEHAKAYAYMNCITLKDYTNNDEFKDIMEAVYIVLQSDNDSVHRGEMVTWTMIDRYIDNILLEGMKDDIECLYCHLTDKY